METSELLKKVRKIEIKTRGLSANIFAGEYHSAFKGRGMAFSEVREYQAGDDIRSIDWNVTARFNHPYVKVFEEEREMTVMTLVDVSGSGDYGTATQQKREVVTQLAALLSFSAIQNNDKAGAIFFSDRIEKFISPQKGRKHTLRIVRELLDFQPQSQRTRVAQALEYLTKAIKKRCTVFIISDFMDEGYENALTIANKKHDVVALRVYDRRETVIPSAGLVYMTDNETGETRLVDFGDRRTRRQFEEQARQRDLRRKEIFSRSGVDHVNISTHEDYVRPLMTLFERRG